MAGLRQRKTLVLFFLRVRLKSLRKCQRVGKRTLASPIRSVDATANSVFDVAQLVCRTAQLDLVAFERVLVACRSSRGAQSCHRCRHWGDPKMLQVAPHFLIRYGKLQFGTGTLFLHCVGAMWFSSAVECCALFVSLCLGGAQFARICFFKCGSGPKVFTLTHRLHFEIHHDVFAAMGPVSTDLRGEVFRENAQDECTSERLMVVCLIVLLVFLYR